MKTLSKTVLVTLAVTLLGSGIGFAEQVARRIDHPNSPPIYVPVHRERADCVPTIGVYTGEGAVVREIVIRSLPGKTDSRGRTMIPLHRGRGEVIYVPVQL